MESVRSLTIQVERRMAEDQMKVLMVTSTHYEEGKTVTAVNLAISLAEKGNKVLLLDLNLRNPSVYQALSIQKNCAKLSDFLTGTISLDEAVYKLNDPLFYLGTAIEIKDPVEVLTSMQLKDAICKLSESMDYIIVDTPSCGEVSDAGTITDYCDGILYVVKQDFIDQKAIETGIQKISRYGKRIIGGVLNNASGYGSSYSYGYGYGYGGYAKKRYGYKYGYGRYGSKYGSNSSKKYRENKNS
ncbi:Tyrosine-protein kinase Wzc [Lachnospiraceae bacterium TWA4]|nr:Tyrosine-protein kinase Wzc [Lachnospiraceae bacterium TWA4]